GGQWGRAGLGRRAGFTGRHGRGGFNAFGFGSGPYGSGLYGFGSGPYAYGFGAAGYAFGSSGPGPAPFRAASWPLGDVPGLPVAAGIPAPPVQRPAIYVLGSERRGPARMRRGGVGGPVTAVSGQQGGSGVVVVGARRTAVR
ncbi:MAG: hypothetical protein JWR86_224, partial [Enterovirga sp.]|nr:hypothetical protein [Enterovirga sp.]